MKKPILKCQRITKSKSKYSFKHYRNISSGFVNKARKYIIEKYGSKCLKCGCESDIQIDHVIPVKYGFDKGFTVEEINTVENLQVLCRSCNSSKSPYSLADYRKGK